MLYEVITHVAAGAGQAEEQGPQAVADQGVFAGQAMSSQVVDLMQVGVVKLVAINDRRFELGLELFLAQFTERTKIEKRNNFV